MKEIREVFTVKFNNGKEYLHIVATSYNSPRVNFGGQEDFLISTDEMRILGNHLIKTADTIDNDADFKKK